MGLLARLGGWYGASPDLAKAAVYASPLLPEDIAALDPVAAAAFGLSTTGSNVVTREEAMTVPAVRRGRAVIAGTIGAQPLVALRGGQLDRIDRILLEQPDPNTTRQHVLTWTVDDLLFEGLAWWYITDRDATGYPTRAMRLAPGRIMIDLSTGTVRVDGQPVPDDRLIRFDGPDEGVLRYGGRTLRTCLLLEDAVRRNADGLPPMDLLSPAGDGPDLTALEIEELLDAWQNARNARATAYVNKAVTHTSVGYDAAAAGLSDARQYQAGEVARLMNLPPRYVNAPSASGMTYTNVQAERLELVDLSLAPYLTAIEQRLSMPDVTPRGQSVRVDLSGFLRGDTKTAVETAAASIAAGLSTADENRADIYNRPPLDQEAPA